VIDPGRAVGADLPEVCQRRRLVTPGAAPRHHGSPRLLSCDHMVLCVGDCGGACGPRFLHTAEVTGSIPVTPTSASGSRTHYTEQGLGDRAIDLGSRELTTRAACLHHDQPNQSTALQLLQRCRLLTQLPPARALVITDEASPFALRSTRNSSEDSTASGGCPARFDRP
jgi:hypothetical protein